MPSALADPAINDRACRALGHQVLHHFLLWRQALLIENQHFATVDLGIMLKSLKTKPAQALMKLSIFYGSPLSVSGNFCLIHPQSSPL